MRTLSRFGMAGVTAMCSVGAAIGACATMWGIAVAVGSGYSTALFATVIALTLSRRTFADRAEFLRTSALLPVVGLAAAAVGWLLVALPAVGAAAFVAGMSLPIWMRRFGERASRAGALITLPFVAILVAPTAPPHTGRWWLDLLMLVGASVVAILWVWLFRDLGALLTVGRAGSVAAAAPTRGRAVAPEDSSRRGATPRPSAGAKRSRALPASTRMALQLAVALTAAFIVGRILFPEHSMWTVFTAFIVCSGNRGRGDVVYKSALRLGGALVGTVGAVALTFVVEPTGFSAVAVIFAALFLGTWLREYSYAYWALTITLVLTMLQGLLGTAPADAGEIGLMLGERMLAIVAGAALGIAASWFLLPVRSADVVRKRLSEALLALTAVFAPPPDDAAPTSRAERAAAFRASVDRLEQLAPAHRAHRAVYRHRRHARPIDCIEAAAALPDTLDRRLAAGARGDAPPAATGAGEADPATERARLRDAIRTARQSLAAPADFDRILGALQALRAALGPPVA
ncbi:FUSC family protein [Leifsonia poae]|uniref:FUSC family protein n=1 Tax=Leifsonia poae TaxID=110933 RepID=UPI001CC0E68F|nr:FUSC family protein [Leifsonia poae]